MKCSILLLAVLFLDSRVYGSALVENDAAGDVDTSTILTTEATSTVSASKSTEAPCQDDPNSNCHQYIHLCDNAKYVPLLETFCPKTCGYCGGGSTKIPSTCLDSSTNCKNWVKNGFCENNFYSCEQKKQYCPMSCGYCAADACKK